MEENLTLSSEDSSCPEDYELELTLGGGTVKPQRATTGHCGRIFTAVDFPRTTSLTSSSSSSSSILIRGTGTVGTKRSAESLITTANGVSPVVGWPPLKPCRLLPNQIKAPSAEMLDYMIVESKGSTMLEKSDTDVDKENGNAEEKRQCRSSQCVKVYMDGDAIGRKVDLKAHSCYEALARTLENMFQSPTTSLNSISSRDEHGTMIGATRSSKLLDGSSEFVLTYEDKEQDWMLVGDVPWGMFLRSVKKLRIMRTAEANGLAPKFRERKGMQSNML